MPAVPLKLFLSYHRPDERFAGRVRYYLMKQPAVDLFFYPTDATREIADWPAEIGATLRQFNALVAIIGAAVGHTQQLEVNTAHGFHLPIRLARLEGAVPDSVVVHSQDMVTVPKDGTLSSRALACAKDIVASFRLPWSPEDGLPLRSIFNYEKRVIEAYRAAEIPAEMLWDGAPEHWPVLEPRAVHDKVPNPVSTDVTGYHRATDARIRVDARIGTPAAEERQLAFPEAGPRASIRFPRTRRLNVAVAVSGGVAPGTNAVITGILGRHKAYRDAGCRTTVYAYIEGFSGMLLDQRRELDLDHTSRMDAHTGGSTMATSRADQLLEPGSSGVVQHLVNAKLHDIDLLYVIGGDGSMRAAHAIATIAMDRKERPLTVIGVPKTTDNDILWVWQSFGFLSSVEKARDFILDLHTEVTSNSRLCVIQLFGSTSGFVVAHAGLAADVCDAVLVPEDKFTLSGLSAYVQAKLLAQRAQDQLPHGILVISETAIPEDADKRLDDPVVGLDALERKAVREFIANGGTVRGQTPDELRTAGMKFVTRVLQHDIRKNEGWESFRVFSAEPRHLIRAIAPSTSDVIFAQRLGAIAVDAAMAGYHDCMVSQWLTEFVLVPLPLVVLGRKRLPLGGVFWKSVLASTGQPSFAP